MTPQLQKLLDQIPAVSSGLSESLQAHIDDLTHPPGSLGRLEDLARRYGLITDTLTLTLGKKRIYTFAADHGIAAEGVSAFPPEVTTQMVLNMLAGGAAVNVLARNAGVEDHVVDIGVNTDFAPLPHLLQYKIRKGTDNICHGPAMQVAEAEKAIFVGVELAQKSKAEGVTLLGTGEMGIANTSSAAALFAALLPCRIEAITGRGTGITDDVLKHKTQKLQQAMDVNRERLTGPLEILAALGGFEIAGICGLCLGAAANRIPVVIDGFISSAAALVACKMNPEVKNYLFFSHQSAEQGHRLFLEAIQQKPLLDLGMRLGEGTGAVLAMSLIEASVKLYIEMATFSGAGISSGQETLCP